MKVNGVRVEVHTDGSILAYTNNSVDAYTNGPVQVHPAANDDAKAKAAPGVLAVITGADYAVRAVRLRRRSMSAPGR